MRPAPSRSTPPALQRRLSERRSARCYLAHSRLRLALEQRALALDAPAVARQCAVVPHHAMARNRHREGVRRAGLRHRTHRARRADPLARYPRSSPSRPPGSCAAPATRAAGTPCRARRAADPGPAPELRRSPPPWRRVARTPYRRRSDWRAESGPADRALVHRDRRPARWRKRRARWWRRESTRASTRRWRSGSPCWRRRRDSSMASYPAPHPILRRSGRWSCSRRRRSPR